MQNEGPGKGLDEHSRVWRQTAVTSEPAVTGMILSEGVVGFGSPLQAILSAVTSTWGCIAGILASPNPSRELWVVVSAYPIVRGHPDAVANV